MIKNLNKLSDNKPEGEKFEASNFQKFNFFGKPKSKKKRKEKEIFESQTSIRNLVGNLVQDDKEGQVFSKIVTK